MKSSEAAKENVGHRGCVEYSSPEEEAGELGPGEWEGENLLGRCLMDVRGWLPDERRRRDDGGVERQCLETPFEKYEIGYI